ncbi:MAG: beta-lactamase family protein, partial [bacterium]|nr:beta-lactamase family protein [bacterium]
MERRKFLAGAGLLAGDKVFGALKRGKLDEAAAWIKKAVDRDHVRAATLHVRQRTFTFRRAFGEARSPDAIFLIASITKPMTATGVMVLADRGELALPDPVHKFIPEFTEGHRRKITIHHLLTHSSGLPDMLPENVDLRKRGEPLSEFVKGTIRTPLLFEPGTQVKYQSMGILLAAEVVQRITGQQFPAFLEKEVFTPLGMKRTALGLGKLSLPSTMQCQVEHAPGLYGGGEDTSSWNWNSPYWRNLAAPWGGAHSTGPDIAKFLENFLNPDGNLLKPETAAAMVKNQTAGLNEPRGIGFVVKPGSFGNACSNRTFGHSGATGTIAWADPASELTCVVLTTLPAIVS